MSIYDLNIDNLLRAAIKDPTIVEEYKKIHQECSEVLSMDLPVGVRFYLEHVYKLLDEFIWSYEASDDPGLVHNMNAILHEAKQMAESEKYTNEDIANYCITRSQNEILPLFEKEFPKLYPDAKYDDMVQSIQVTLNKAYSDIDYLNLSEQEIIDAVLKVFNTN